MINWTEVIIAVVGIVFTGVLIPLIKAGFEWLKGKTQNEALLTALSEFEFVADTVVASLQQTIVADIKDKSEDGKLTPEDAKAIAERALDMFFADISEKSVTLITDNADSITDYIKNLLEARLLKLKS